MFLDFSLGLVGIRQNFSGDWCFVGFPCLGLAFEFVILVF